MPELPWWLSGKESTYSAGAKGLIPDLGRSHVRWSISPRTQLLSLCSRAWELQLLKLKHLRGFAPKQEKAPQSEALVIQLDSIPYSPELETKPHSNESEVLCPIFLLKTSVLSVILSCVTFNVFILKN